MALYIVCYEAELEQRGPGLVDARIKAMGGTRLHDTTWGVETDLSADGLFGELEHLVAEEDRLLVVAVQPRGDGGPRTYAWQNALCPHEGLRALFGQQ